jgi:hypothetical protein
LLVVTPLFAGSRESAFLAQDILGPDIWSRVVRIERAPLEGDRRPAEMYGLVVAFADILWYYNEYDGTQNLSTHQGRLSADKANLAQLLREIDPALIRFTEETERPPPALMPDMVPNACFLSCLRHWEMLQRSAHPPKRVRLIACFPPGSPTQGHMILEYRRGLRRFVFDPDRPTQQITIPFWVSGNPLTTAKRALRERWLTPPASATEVALDKIIGPASKNFIATGASAERRF